MAYRILLSEVFLITLIERQMEAVWFLYKVSSLCLLSIRPPFPQVIFDSNEIP